MSSAGLLDDAKLSRRVGVRFVSLIVPVTATILVVVWSVCCLSPIYVDSANSPFSIVVNEESASTVEQRLGYALLAAVAVVVFVVLITFAIVLLYHFHMQFILYGWLAFSALSMFFLLVWVWLDLVCTHLQIPYEKVTMGIFVWNFGAGGLLSVFYYAHPAVTQGYLIMASVLIAWSLTSLPEWTTWSLLFCIASYDIVAVLWKQGPLHRLIQVAHERQEPIPGFVYDSANVIVPLSRETAAVPHAAEDPPAPALVDPVPEETVDVAVRHSAPFKLGLGDFIFYSLLVGRASMTGFVSWTCCLISVLSGMVGTLLMLLLFRNSLRALPALPCSIFLSMVVFVLCVLLLEPLSGFAGQRFLLL